MPREEDIRTDDHRITFRALLLGFVFAGIFAVLSVKGERLWRLYTVTQIPVLPYVLLLASVLALNPILRHIRVIRPLSSTELLIVFVMGMVSSGIPSLGMASHLVPRMSSLFVKEWNTDQSRWDLYIEPYVREDYFIAEPGTQKAAARLQEVDSAWREADTVYHAAKRLKSSEDQLAATIRELEEARRTPDDEERREKVRAASHRRALARMALKRDRKWWEKYSDRYDRRQVIDTFSAKVEKLREGTERRKAELDAIEAPAFEKVEVFRKGLPKDMRAIPGFIYAGGEGLASYLARIRRLVKGMAAFKELQQAEEKLGQVSQPGHNVTAEVAGHLRKALDELEPVSNDEALSHRSEEIKKEIGANEDLRSKEERKLRILHKYRRYAHADEFDGYDRRIKATERTIRGIKAEIEELKSELNNKITPQLDVLGKMAQTKTVLKDILADLERATPNAYAKLREELLGEMDRFGSFDASFRRFLVGDIDWMIWLKPLLNWSALILLIYLVLMTFNILIFRQWAHNEKLVYPLAELPALLAGAEDQDGRTMPSVFKTGLFWAGAAVPVFFHGWNHVIQQHVPGLGQIPLTWQWQPFVQGSVLDALRPGPQFEIFFALIGLTFLIPARISYSLWSCHLLYMVQLLVVVWLGYGVCEESFPQDRLYTPNFRTAEGGGALIVFAVVILWKCRKYIFCCVTPTALEGLDEPERKELRISSWLFLFGSVAFVAMLTNSLGANVFYSIFYYFMILVIVIGLMRAVAEGGLLTYKCYFGPFHFIRSVFGMNHTWTAASLMAPLFVFNSILFMQYKTLIAPAMANALKIRDKLRVNRLGFHGAMAAAILCAFVVGLLAHIIVGYSYGANHLSGWLYNHVPRVEVFGTMKDMATTEPVDIAGCKWWILTGAVAMVALLYFRRRVFWLPHPIGLIMFVNPVMHPFWFSIFIGWIFKVLVSKYGNKDTYVRLRCFFIGLLAAEIVMCLLLAGPGGVDFNRN